MWTPRRLLLLMLGAAGFVAVYVAYASFLGGIDGLPQLPPEYLPSAGPPPVPTPLTRGEPLVYARLREAFGPDSYEVTDPVAYKTRLEKRDRGMVFACGQPVLTGSPEVTVSPFSVAFFGKPRPEHQRAPGEVTEITTFHADMAVLEFDRPVRNAQELADAKMIGMKLLGTPEMPSHDPRKGQIWVTNNQRSAEPGDALLFRTPGPLYYESPDHPARKNPDAPNVWTHAAVEVVDLRNLPRPLRAAPPRPVPLRAEDASVATARADSLRGGAAIADILLGATLPPPTITAHGMNVFLEQQKPGAAKPKAGPKDRQNTTGFTGVKSVELRENVQLCLWSDGGSGLPGATTAPAAANAAPTPPPAPKDPPLAGAALAGSLVDATAISRRMDQKTLLVAETLGTFRYDFDANTARFESAPSAPDAVTNFVTVARLSARGKQDDLSCKMLLVEFEGGPDRAADGGATATSSSGGMKIKTLTATGAHVYMSFEGEQLTALGTDLRHSVDAKARTSTTILKGAPVNAVRGRNKLLAGGPDAPAEVVIVTTDPAPGTKDRKHTAMSVRGKGRMDIFDEASGDTTLQATWGKSLTHEKERVGAEDQDLLKFEGGGSFVDVRGNMRLAADQLWLWLSQGGGVTGTAKAAGDGSKALPQRLRAVGHVDGNTADLVIQNTDLFTVWFRDVPPPADPVPAKAPIAAVPPPAGPVARQPPTVAPPPAQVAAQPPAAAGPNTPPKAEPAKKDPPTHLSARLVESWMVRYPTVAAPAAKPGQPGAAPAVAAAPPRPGQPAPTRLKYEMERARCEDRVVVHQDPVDPAKAPVGAYIAGTRLNIDQSRAGSVMTVSGADQTWAQVHYENLSLFGPTVVIDQPNNAASVDGRGMLRMPGEQDPAEPAKKPSDLEIQWARSMRFRGTNGTGATAAFVGQVQAVQMPNRPAVGPRVDLAPGPKVRHTALRPGRPDELAAPQAAAAVAPADTWDRSVVLCHQLDVTFDKPVYFNEHRPGGSAAGPAAKKDEERAKLKTALCTPMPDDEAAQVRGVPVRLVVYQTDTFGRDNKPTESRRVEAQQIDLRREERGQRVYAAGPGEVRILQPGARDEFGSPQTAPAPPGQAAPAADQEMKLTVVKFLSRMDGTEKAGAYQEAVFHDGARVYRVPSADLGLRFAEHAPPKRTTFLSCTDRLTVSSARPTAGGPAEQQMVADGNGEFRNTEYEGTAARITYRENVVTLQGGASGLARLYRLRRSVAGSDDLAARTIYYHRDGRVDLSETSSGTVTSP